MTGRSGPYDRLLKNSVCLANHFSRTQLRYPAMLDRRLLFAVGASLLGLLSWTQGPRHLNPVIDLLAEHKPVFGVYGPRNPRARPGATAETHTRRQQTPAES